MKIYAPAQGQLDLTTYSGHGIAFEVAKQIASVYNHGLGTAQRIVQEDLNLRIK